MNAQPPDRSILFITDDCIAPSHGTGAALLRHFAEFPRERMLHFYLNRKGDPVLPHAWQVAAGAHPSHGPAWRRWIRKPPEAANGLHIDAAMEALLGTGQTVDLVYSAVFGEVGLQLVQAAVQRLPDHVPVIHHAMDFLYEGKRSFEQLLRDIAPRITEFWAIGQGLADELHQVTGRTIRLVHPFQSMLNPVCKTGHREFGATTRAVMLGNSHMPWVLHHLGTVWGRIREATPGLEPIQWYGYPSALSYVTSAGVVIEPHIEYYGFLNDKPLHEHLVGADFAIVPFNIEDEPEYHYARYSIPSRITEFMNAALPIFAAAGAHTEARRFIESHDIGVCATLAREEEFHETLLAFARDRGRRETYGRRGRAYAEEACDLVQYRKTLRARLESIVRGEPSD